MMQQDIVKYVQQCANCQRTKHENLPYPSLLQPLPIPTQVWTHINMDFLECFPISDGCDAILVVVDRLSKMGHFMALSHPFTARDVAQSFIDNVFKLHGVPATITSNRDKLFTSLFWKEFFKLIGTKLQYSTAYHPQTDGQSERLIQCLEAYLRCMCADKPHHWKNWLPLAEWWYNTNFHTGIKMTPFEACYGYKPLQLPLATICDSVAPVASQLLRDRQEVLLLLQDHFGPS